MRTGVSPPPTSISGELFCEGAFRKSFRIAASQRNSPMDDAPQMRESRTCRVRRRSLRLATAASPRRNCRSENIGIGQQVDSRSMFLGSRSTARIKIAFAAASQRPCRRSMQVTGKGEKGNAVRHAPAGPAQALFRLDGSRAGNENNSPAIVRCASAESGCKAQRRLGSDLTAHELRARSRIEVEKIEEVVGAGSVSNRRGRNFGITRRRFVKQPDRF